MKQSNTIQNNIVYFIVDDDSVIHFLFKSSTMASTISEALISQYFEKRGLTGSLDAFKKVTGLLNLFVTSGRRP